MKKFNVSLDGKTVQEIETDSPINFIAQKYNVQFVLDSFTLHDIHSGETKMLLAKKGKKRFKLFMGENLRSEDLQAKYDSFGTLIK